MYSVSSELRSRAADLLLEAVGESDYFSGVVEFEHGDVECRLVVSVLAYHQEIDLPEGTARVVSDLVPVWWTFHTVTAEGEVLNDFDFADLRALLR